MYKFLASVLLFSVVMPVGAQDLGRSITPSEECFACNMIVAKYPGPKGQIVTKDGNIHSFCSVKCMTCAYLSRDKSNVADVLGHNTEAVDWAAPSDKEFISLKDAYVVVGSSKRATMGKSVAPFKTKEAAEKFAGEFGGAVYAWRDLTPDVLGCRKPRKDAVPF